MRGSGCSLWDAGVLVCAEYVLGSKTGQRAEMWTEMADAVDVWANNAQKKGSEAVQITAAGTFWVSDATATGITDFVCEFPTTYNGRSARGDTRDVLDLSAVVGALCQVFREAKTKVYLPAEYKGQLPKAIAHQRMFKELSSEEAARIVAPKPKSLIHNVHDSVFMALRHLKRL